MDHREMTALLTERGVPAEPPLQLFTDRTITGALPMVTSIEMTNLAKALGFPPPVSLGFGLWATVALVTPQQAHQILTGHSTINRSLVESQRSRLREDLISGEWKLHHQGIAFRSDGNLQDGHHRLYSIVEANVSALLAVYFNITNEAQLAIDSQRTRRPHDVAAFLGVRVDQVDVAIIRRAYLGLKYDHLHWSNQEAINMVSAYREPLDWAKHRRHKLPASYAAGIVRAWHHVDHELLDEFTRIVGLGSRKDGTLRKEDGTAVHFAKWLQTAVRSYREDGNRGEAPQKIYGKTCRAIEAWLAGEILSKFPPPSVEVYSLPQMS